MDSQESFLLHPYLEHFHYPLLLEPQILLSIFSGSMHVLTDTLEPLILYPFWNSLTTHCDGKPEYCFKY